MGYFIHCMEYLLVKVLKCLNLTHLTFLDMDVTMLAMFYYLQHHIPFYLHEKLKHRHECNSR